MPFRRTRRWLLMMAIVVASVAFLPPILWSQWGPALVGRALSTRLHTSVTVQRVTGGGWRSVEIQHLTMAESAAPHALPLLQFERLTIDRGLLPLLFSTKPVALRIDSVDLQLRQQQDGQWNLAALVHALQGAPSSPGVIPLPPFSLNRLVNVAVTHG